VTLAKVIVHGNTLLSRFSLQIGTSRREETLKGAARWNFAQLRFRDAPGVHELSLETAADFLKSRTQVRPVAFPFDLS
jgi:hypothetical protein